MIDLRNLETLIWVARLGGFSLAAQRLNTTQPGVSQRISMVPLNGVLRLYPVLIFSTVKAPPSTGQVAYPGSISREGCSRLCTLARGKSATGLFSRFSHF